MDISSYIENLISGKHTALFDQDCCRAFKEVAASFGTMVSNETIQEIDLSSPWLRGDYSFKIDRKDRQPNLMLFREPLWRQRGRNSQAWAAVEKLYNCWCSEGSAMAEKVGNLWLEMDYELCRPDMLEPCLFFDATQVFSGQDNSWLYENPLLILLGASRCAQLQEQLDACMAALAVRNLQLFQIGVMLGRRTDDVRIFTSEMNKTLLLEYLTELKWSGDISSLSRWLELLEPYIAHYILDFDVNPHGISPKIGMNFGLKKSRDSDIEDFLAFLHARSLCTEAKRLAIGDWLQEFPDFTNPIYNDVSHFKFSYTGEEDTPKVKAYLRQGTLPRRPFLAFSQPRMMNIELTTRCPLHCPQCYCDLTRGKDMAPAVAIRFIKEAGVLKIPQINLSGGETMLYPHLLDLIACCRDNGICANVALSGYGFNEDVLRQMEAEGVGGIFISLNGSTEEVNSCSRDGFDLAIKALQVLKNAHFLNYAINWVANRGNVADFPNILSLAESYETPAIVVMAFKPDASREMSAFPSREQLIFLADYIKEHRNSKVKIKIENCFSQLKALIGQKYFINLNQGIDKGCQAGRDSMSVSVDGKLTPCRHLEYEESYASIAEYWNNSPVLEQLRDVENDTRKPCQGCQYEPYCLYCMAVNAKLKGELFKGNEFCGLSTLAERA